jgi:hypothetical protein
VPADARIARSFYLRVTVPDDAAPGIYEGAVTFTAANGAQASLPLQVRVLPFTLPAQPLAIGGYYGLPSGSAMRMYRFTQADTEPFANMIRRWNTAHFALMRDLGMTHVSTNTWWRPFVADEQGNVTVSEPAHRYDMMIGDLIRDAGFESFSMFGIGWTALMDGVPGFLTLPQIGGKRPEEIVFPDSALVPAAAVLKAVYDEAEERNWPALPFYVSDELGNEGAIGADYGEALVKFLVKARQMSGHDFKLIASTLRFSISERMLPHLDAIIPNSAWPINSDTIATARRAGAELWLYNIGENRLSFGFYPWRVDAKARLQWAWDWNGRSMDPLFGLDGSETQYDVVMGPGIKAIPSYGWLVLAAEGAKDRRYMALLDQKLATQPTGSAADAARAVLAELKQRINETYLDPVNNWQPGTYDYFRWRIAQAVMALDSHTDSD